MNAKAPARPRSKANSKSTTTPRSTRSEKARGRNDGEVLLSLMDGLGKAQSSGQAIATTLDLVRDALGWAYGSFWSLDTSTQTLRFQQESGSVNDDFRQVTLSASFREGEGLSGRAWRDRDLVYVEDLSKVRDCVRAPVAHKSGVRSGICFPVSRDGRVVGTMDFFALERRSASQQDLELFRGIGQFVSSALDRLWNAERMAASAADFRAIIRVVEDVASAESEEQTVRAALSTIQDVFGWAYGSYWTVDPAVDGLRFNAEMGSVSEEFRRITRDSVFREGVGLNGRAWKERKLVFVPDIGDVQDCARAPAAKRAGVKSGVCFPLLQQGKVVATMDFFSMERLQLSSDRLDALSKMGELVAAGLLRVRQMRAAETEAANATRSIGAVRKLVESVERGELRQRIEVAQFEGTYRELCEGVNRMMDGIATPLDEIARVLDLVAHGDLRQRVEGAYENDLDTLKQSVNGTIEQLSKIAVDMRTIAGHVAHASEEISSGTADLSKRTEQQAASLEETASTMEEMTATVKQNAENARQANQLAMSARSVAEKGGEVVRQAVSAMEEINKSSAKIADIISVIDAIAFQTNLLALNAAVEAARAGEQGRGFAVVASEVRNLAQRSATAAKEIKGLINDSSAKVAGGSQLVQQSGNTLSEIVASVKKVADIVGEISAASQEQSTAIEQINTSVTRMDEFTQQNSALVEETASAASSMASQGSELLNAISIFKVESGEGSAELPPPAKKEAARAPASRPQRAAPAPSYARRELAPATKANHSSPPKRTNGHALAKHAQDEDGFLEF